MTEMMLADAAARPRPPLRGAALLQRRRRRPEGTHRPIDAGTRPISSRSPRRPRSGQRPHLDVFGNRLSDPRRHLHPRLHPRHRSRPRPCRRAPPPPRGRREHRRQLRLRPGLLGARGDRDGEARLRGRFRGPPRPSPRPATRRRSSPRSTASGPWASCRAMTISARSWTKPCVGSGPFAGQPERRARAGPARFARATLTGAGRGAIVRAGLTEEPHAPAPATASRPRGRRDCRGRARLGAVRRRNRLSE